MAQQKIENVNIDGTEYSMDQLNDNAKAQINNLRLAEAEINRLQVQLGLAQTAKAAYSQTLKIELAKGKTEETAEA